MVAPGNTAQQEDAQEAGAGPQVQGYPELHLRLGIYERPRFNFQCYKLTIKKF